MAEELTFGIPQPIGAAPTANTFRIMAIHKRREPWSIHFEVRAGTIVFDIHIEGAEAETLIKALNKRNNSVKSEERFCIEQLQAAIDPKTGVTYLPAGGAFTGSPD